MATLTATQCQAACDNLAVLVADATVGQPTSAQIAQIVTDANTELTRILAFTDTLVGPAMSRGWARVARSAAVGNLGASRLLTAMNALGYGYVLTNGPFEACDTLDFSAANTTGNTGLANFLANNSILVDQYFADLFNQFVQAVSAGAYIRDVGTNALAKIPSSSIFVHANADYVNQWTATGASTGTLVAGNTTLATATGGNTTPGGGTLEAYAGNAIGASGYTIQATYTSIAGTTNQTVTFTVPASAAANTVFTPGASVQAASIQAITVTAGSATSGDIIRFRLKPARAITA